MGDALVAILLFLVALVGFASKKAIELVLEQEYVEWARSLARLASQSGRPASTDRERQSGGPTSAIYRMPTIRLVSSQRFDALLAHQALPFEQPF